jgi:hypothetical protein
MAGGGTALKFREITGSLRNDRAHQGMGRSAHASRTCFDEIEIVSMKSTGVRQFPVPSRKFPVPREKIPCSAWLRELGCKPLIYLIDWTQKTPKRAESGKIP